MASAFTRYLLGDGNFGQNLVNGLVKPKGLMANWQHATRIFVDNTYRLAPRQKFLYYALFEINPRAHNAAAFTAKHAQEVGLLCKTAELPKFTFDTAVKNQYNRKKLVYKQITYDPVNLTMHDDNSGIISSLWAIYYGAYIQDRKLPESAYKATHLRRGSVGALDSFRYGLDNDKTEDMFLSISLFTMSRSRFTGYTLVNPRITNWSHGQVDYSSNDNIETSMTLQYEAVKYTSGNVTRGTPKGFATLHYDTAPSPLTVAGGGVANLFGGGGVLDGIEQIAGDIAGIAGGSIDGPQGFLSTAVKSINTYNNFKGLSKDSILREAGNILNSPAGISGIVNTVGGIVGSVFPKNTPSASSVTASIKKFFG